MLGRYRNREKHAPVNVPKEDIVRRVLCITKELNRKTIGMKKHNSIAGKLRVSEMLILVFLFRFDVTYFLKMMREIKKPLMFWRPFSQLSY